MDQNFTSVQNSKVKVFISYSHQDILLKRFIELGLGNDYDYVWSDHHLVGGDRWYQKILAEVAESDVFILFVSEDAIDSLYCRAELSEALRLQKEIVPVAIRDARYIPAKISEYQVVKLWSEVDTAQVSHKLINVINQRLSTRNVLSELWSRKSPQPKVTNRFSIPAHIDPSENESALNTGIFLIRGDKLEIKATGKITIDKNLTEFDANGIYRTWETPPTIYPHFDVYSTRKELPQELIEKGIAGLAGSLIGWIGDGNFLDSAFLIGAQRDFAVSEEQEGFLYLGVNDVKGEYGDNTGSFDVSVRVYR